MGSAGWSGGTTEVILPREAKTTWGSIWGGGAPAEKIFLNIRLKMVKYDA